MDVKAAVDGGLAALSDLMKLLPSFNGALIFGAVCILAAYFLARSSLGKRARVGLEETMFSNWRLALLGATGVILSLASGYTTWDGMRNFTGEAVLSGMVTFGIQGVMLIVAWLIGESFAVGMNQIAPDGTKRTAVDNKIGMVLGTLLVGVTFYWFARSYGGMSVSGRIGDVTKFSNLAIYFAFGLLLLALLMLSGAYNQPRIAGHEQDARYAGELSSGNAPLGARVAAPAIAPPKPRVMTDEEVRQQFIDQLVQAIGVRPEIYAQATGPAIGAAISAGEAFSHVRDRNPVLARSLRERDERAEKAFFEAYSAIQGRIADHDEHSIDLLNDAYEELRNRWPVLMLMPEGPYENLFEDLIAKLEPAAGAGRLSADDRNLLLQLKALKAQLATSTRNSADDWHRLEGAFQPNAADPTHVVRFEQAAKTRYQG